MPLAPMDAISITCICGACRFCVYISGLFPPWAHQGRTRLSAPQSVMMTPPPPPMKALEKRAHQYYNCCNAAPHSNQETIKCNLRRFPCAFIVGTHWKRLCVAIVCGERFLWHRQQIYKHFTAHITRSMFIRASILYSWGLWSSE